jgi:DAK2 domain fusion protein YloV
MKILNGEDLDALEAAAPAEAIPGSVDIDFSKFGPDSVMEYGYCTEMLVQLMNYKTDVEAFDVDALKEFLASLGDSIVAYKTGTIIKIHVHTLTPYKVLEHMHEYGEFLTIKIENMSVQHNEIVEKPPVEKPHKRYGIVAVANGEGISELYTKLGADEIVSGGQTMNPSAQNFLEVFEKINADHIIVFPNNSNIILAARQAAKIYENAQIHVINSKSIGDCYAALSVINLENEDVEALIEDINESMGEVETGFVTYAVRNTEMNGVKVHEGDYISFCDKQMMASEPDIIDATMKLLEGMNAEDRDIVNIFYGKSVDDELLESLIERIEEAYPDIEVQSLNGGQEVYRFIVVVE